ncbi:SDR family NAD(P)-dependent oxidoreductase [Cohnella sp.]|uniref:SDR family NAD(P)-dependent oxidoreductase n=1 Tax=Cohnella sp. TaxID=1883426 RepID=UPI003703AB72
MGQGHFIITGTSRGIGRRLAELLLERGDYVHGISRGPVGELERYERYLHKRFDLSEVDELEPLLDDIVGRIDTSDTNMVCLINNAAVLEPLKHAEHCSAKELNRSLQTSLLAPMVLSSRFLKLTESFTARRKIINISSGSGTSPIPGMSAYCSAKAGINMFTRCIGMEQAEKDDPVEIVGVDPGMVDTDMQTAARGQDERFFQMAAFFQEAYREGQLKTTYEVGERLLSIIDTRYESGQILNCLDI